MLKELKAFLFKGNVLDLAVAVILGAAFSAVVTSLVKDVITPIIGMIIGQPDFSGIKLGSIAIGNFINAIVNFLIVGTILFFIVQAANRALTLTKKSEESEEAAPTQEELLTEIRDLLAKK